MECVLSELEKLVEAAAISKCPLHFPQRILNETLSSFFLVFIVLKTCLILGSGENLSFVLYYEFCYIRIDNTLGSMG